MLYESYQTKIKKIARTLSKLVKFSPLIIGATVLVIAGIVALLVSKGSVGELSCSAEVTYGDRLELECSAFLSGIEYEYSADGSDWSEAQPLTRGEYQVRAKAYDLLGNPRYSDVKSFKINPRSSDLAVAGNSMAYGDLPALAADLQYKDHIVCDAFDIENEMAIGKETTVTPLIDHVKVISESGENVTDSYVFKVETKTVRITQRPIEITVPDHSEIYNGKEIKYHVYDITSGSLKDGDELKNVKFGLTLLNCDSQKNTIDFTIKNKDGVDVTACYKIVKREGSLTVAQRPLMIETSSKELDYTGKNVSITNEDFRIAGGTSLADKHELVLVGYASMKDVGEYSNTPVFEIVDAYGNDVTDNYRLELDEGTIKINAIELLVKTGSGSWVYDGSYHFDDAVYPTGALAWHTVEKLGSAVRVLDYVEGGVKNERLVRVIDREGIDVTHNYIVKYDYGMLVIQKRSLYIHTPNADFLYDGIEHDTGNPAVTGLAPTDSLFGNGTKVTDAGKYENSFTEYYILNNQGIEKTKNYDITHEFGTLTVNRREISIKPADMTKVYNGAYQAPTEFVIAPSSKNGLANGHVIEGEINGKIRDVGTGVSTIKSVSIKSGGKDVTKNYQITKLDGKMKIEKRSVVILTLDKHWTYDGKSHNYHGYSTALGMYEIAKGEKLVVDVSSEVTEVPEGKVLNVFSKVRVVTDDSEERDVTKNYSLDIRNEGYIWIDPREITVILESKSWKYDDTAHSHYEPKIGRSGLAEGEIVEVSEYPDITDVGMIDNYIKYRIVKSNPTPGEDPDKTANYIIYEDFGYIEITPRILKFNLPDKTWTYDAEEHFFIDYTFDKSGDKPVIGHTVVIHDYAKITDAGEVQNFIDVRVIVAVSGGISSDKTHNYVLDMSGVGKLIVDKKYIKIKTNSLTVTYDGEQHSTDLYTIVGGGLVKGQYIVVMSSTVVEDYTPEPVNNEFVIEIRGTGGIDRSYNYDIEYEYGKLTVNKRVLRVVTKDMTWLYDGKAHSHAKMDLAVVITNNGLADGQSAVVDKYATITDAGFIKNEVSIRVIKDDPRPDENKDKTSNYDIRYTYGILTVNKRKIVIYTGSESGIYNGQPYFSTDYTVTGDGFAPDQTLKVIKSTEVENYTPTPVNNEFLEYEIIDLGGNDRKSNYTVNFEYGKITVDKRQILIKTESMSWTYDGKEHQYAYDEEGEFLFKLLNDGLADGQRFVIEEKATITNAGSVTNKIIGKIYKEHSVTGETIETTENYIITTDYGTLTVNKRRVHIVTETNHDVVYDGNAHVFGGYIEYEEGLAPDQTIRFSSSTAITYVTEGVVDNVFYDVEIIDTNKVNTTDNYEFTIEWGQISIKKRTVILTTNSDSKIFDGKPLTCTKYELSDESEYDIVSGETFKVNSSSSVTYVTEGEVENKFTSVSIIDGSGIDRYPNYDIQYAEYGILKINKRAISVYSGSAEKMYDGTPLTNPECGLMTGVSYGTLVKGHTITVRATGTVLLPETVDNTVECVIVDADGNDMTENYQINTRHIGKLTVIGRLITVKVAVWSKEYNGTEWRMTANDCRAFCDSDMSVEITELNVSRTDVGCVTLAQMNEEGKYKDYITFRAFLIDGEEKIEITEYCAVKFESFADNVLEITPKSITLTANSITKKYDENNPYLIADPNGFAVTVGPLAEGDTVQASVYGTVHGSPNETVSGEARIEEESVIIVNRDGKNVTSNYNITLNTGLLEIVPDTSE